MKRRREKITIEAIGEAIEGDIEEAEEAIRKQTKDMREPVQLMN